MRINGFANIKLSNWFTHVPDQQLQSRDFKYRLAFNSIQITIEWEGVTRVYIFGLLLDSATLTRHRPLVRYSLLRASLGLSVRLFAESFSRVSSGYRRNSLLSDIQVRGSLRALAWPLVKDVVHVYRHCSRARGHAMAEKLVTN